MVEMEEVEIVSPTCPHCPEELENLVSVQKHMRMLHHCGCADFDKNGPYYLRVIKTFL